MMGCSVSMIALSTLRTSNPNFRVLALSLDNWYNSIKYLPPDSICAFTRDDERLEVGIKVQRVKLSDEISTDKIEGGPKFSADHIFGGQNFSADEIFRTN